MDLSLIALSNTLANFPRSVDTDRIPKTFSIDMKRVAAIILGGGQGKRLFPLTMSRCKPLMCYGGRYRLIDIPISNALNSGCQTIFVLTQFLSNSLNQHIYNTYRSGTFHPRSIEILSVEEKPKSRSWFEGTADAVRQNFEYLAQVPADYFVILSGDQLYRMDIRELVQCAQEKNADVVVAALPVSESDAKRMGVLKIDAHNFIRSFYEKPQVKRDLDQMRLLPEQLEHLGIDPLLKRDYLGSMGIYLFKKEALFYLLQKDLREDFGKHLIPTQVSDGNIAAFIHQGYWEDIGTIESFYNANMALTLPSSQFKLHQEGWPFISCFNNVAAAHISCSNINCSIICEGSIIEADEITRCILGPRTIIHEGAFIRNSYIIGNDYFYPSVKIARLPDAFQIGEKCIIFNAIIDKHVNIGKGVQLINKNKLSHYDSEDVYIRDGIIIVPQGSTIPPGFIL